MTSTVAGRRALFQTGESMLDSRTFAERVDNTDANLTVAEARAAGYLVEHSTDAASMSISDVARRSGTAEATVSRLARSLGYSGFKEMMIRLFREASTEPIRTIPATIRPDDDVPAVAEKLGHSLVRSLTDSLRLVSFSEVARAVELIMRADRIFIYGVGGSGYVAEIAHHLLLKAGIVTHAYGDGYLQAVSAAVLGKKDLVIGISHSGETRDVVEAMRLARSRGASTVAVTGGAESSILQFAEIQLITASHEEPVYGDFIEAKVCQLLVIDLLYVCVLLRDVRGFTENLDDTAQAIWDRSYGNREADGEDVLANSDDGGAAEKPSL